MTGRRRVRDEHGFVLPTRLMVFSISAVAIAGLAFVATQGDDKPDTASPAASSSKTSQKPAAKPTKKADPVPPATSTPKPPPVVDRAKVFVVVFNNSNIKGLAGRIATRAQGAGWNVVGSDNWYGTIDTSTVYYGPKLKAAADLLAKDLGVTRVKPAIDPMRADRLTVILTQTFH
ncbi:MAG: LytR C-terminal domain-containing protein [Nocardioidaceae bacterium]|nr:LytR C-terminal domain-containing protein [Nocardioidaceae bacterium]